MVLGIGALMVGGFVAALWFGAHRSETGASDYTVGAERVELVSSVPETRFLGQRRSRTEGLQTQYLYLAGSQWYASDVWLNVTGDIFVPSDGEVVRAVCFDPDDPARHRLLLREGATCGDGNIGPVSSPDGKPTDAP